MGTKKFDKLANYADEFFSYIKATRYVSNDYEKAYISESISSYFQVIRDEIEADVGDAIQLKGAISDADTQTIVDASIKEHFDLWSNREFIDGFPKTWDKKFVLEYGALIRKTIQDVFESLPIKGLSRNRLTNLAAMLFSRPIFSPATSGVVIAGFGNKDIYPAVMTYDVECRVGKLIKAQVNKNNSSGINEENTASIIPFAQTEMVATFMEGIDPSLDKAASDYVETLLEKYAEVISSNLGLSKEKEKSVRDVLQSKSSTLSAGYRDFVKSYRMREHVAPILDMVAVLPKDELATVAETLVNITSFKRKVTAVQETVGGPVDVAVISKGDGLLWIKRKHYFQPELNHHFFANYYRRECDEKR